MPASALSIETTRYFASFAAYLNLRVLFPYSETKMPTTTKQIILHLSPAIKMDFKLTGIN